MTSCNASGSDQICREKIRWIAFDGVGTLLFPDPPVAVAYHRVGLQHGSMQTQDEVWRRFQERFNAVEVNETSESRLETDESRELERWRRIVLEVFDDVANPQSCFETLYAHFGTPQAWRCHREARAVLPQLKSAGFRLALASNFDARLEAIANGLVELASMDLRVISSLVGHRKPSPLFYEALIAGAGCHPEEILMVGDDFENDVAGARRVGLQALHFTSKPTNDLARTVSSLFELAKMLQI